MDNSMKRAIKVIVISVAFPLLLLISPMAFALDIVLVANKSHASLYTISIIDTKNIFLGKKSRLMGELVKPVVLSTGKAKKYFNEVVLNMSSTELINYWIKENLAGGAAAPKSLRSVKSIIRYVKKKKGAIAYLNSSDAMDSGLVIIKIIE